jgi:6,7-dimethyl-8-ribityllumazine synthase
MTPSLPAPRIAIVVSGFNPEVTDGLLNGALSQLAELGAPVAPADVIPAPGAFELPLIAQALVRTGRYDGVVCLGCVIKGDTAHFEFISLGASLGLMMAGLMTETPITFGVLTTYTDDQALVRSRDDSENKGREASAACHAAITTLRAIEHSARPPIVSTASAV